MRQVQRRAKIFSCNFQLWPEIRFGGGLGEVITTCYANFTQGLEDVRGSLFAQFIWIYSILYTLEFRHQKAILADSSLQWNAMTWYPHWRWPSVHKVWHKRSSLWIISAKIPQACCWWPIKSSLYCWILWLSNNCDGRQLEKASQLDQTTQYIHA